MLCWCVWFAVLGTLLLSEQLSKDRFQFVSFLGGRRGGGGGGGVGVGRLEI